MNEGFWMTTRHCVWLVLLLYAAGCVVNPVTGEREVGWVSTESQISIGKRQYGPAQQMQGGRYVVDPQVLGYVSAVGQRVSKFSPVDLPFEFVVLNNSLPNAWALPGGKIAINRGLLVELETEAELASVLGHEIVHAAARHGAQYIERGAFLQGAVVAVAIGAIATDYGQALLQGAQVAAGLINQKYGRDAERESDLYGTRFMAQAGYDPQASVSLQETFVRLSGDRSEGWSRGLFASHPPSRERVRNNRVTVDQLRAEGFENGEIGRDRHRRAIATLVRDKVAYDEFDQARALLSDDEVQVALEKIRNAIGMQNAEPEFHALRGHIRLSQERWADAVTNYDRAVARYDGMFSYYVGRGLAHAGLGQRGLAKTDLTRSLELLPTAIAHLELGKIAEADADLDAAVDHFEEAAGGKGKTATEARANLVRVDLPRRPDRYLRTSLSLDDDGRVVMQVVNSTAIDLGDLTFEVEVGYASGERVFHPTIGVLNANTSQLVLVSDRKEQIKSGAARVVSAAAHTD
ncbi:MAG: M48 family metalloprotease [Pseudomonadales bacterium]|jgi:predicted Zn-dependent protease|nr:M48 family metalloprotease [Pseudomonadales bacterium]MDP6470446.1 M48 family metalloprotease [Pseudomonadales bacterium]MDP6827747.1 M48 family metalloprotease [Pseudomonadales bacterium]MDP6973390.1 M48 family metalloprotease [Pseudomonadales bacterium]|tara:strand:- start:402 stop:1961 length:1560 start_codon:yes stop_codon:yes gene_type:complete